MSVSKPRERPEPPQPIGSAEARVALMTAPDLETARRIARALVESKVCACVNLLPGATSIYRWKGAVEEASEVLLVAKTTESRVAELESALSKAHPYEVPELVVLTAAHVEAKYLAWLVDETR
jgi:periplasmic divalent cation tolerance protein